MRYKKIEFDNVLSLFDGMSCLQIALRQSGIKYKKYFASEIDKSAIKATQHNFPKTIQLGDVTKVRGYDLPKIDFIGGGSPCQGFSFAGKMLNFDDPRSKLFFEYVRILKECKEKNPDLLFLLENVPMEKEHEIVISRILGVNPVKINSSLVSAQNRERLYWFNFGLEPQGFFNHLHSTVKQPKDEGIVLNDILEQEVDEKYYLNEAQTKRLLQSSDIEKKFSSINPEKALPMLSRQYANYKGNFVKIDKQGNVKPNQNKASCFTAGGHSGGNHSDMDLILVGSVVDHGKLMEMKDKSTCLDSSYHKGHNNHGARTMVVCHNSMQRSGDPKKGGTGHLARADGKSYALDTQQSNRVQRLGRLSQDSRIRRLTPKECCRLQTVPDNFFDGTDISDSARYKMLGNGWTINVITHILSYVKHNK